MNPLPVLLALEDGRSFFGRPFGVEGEASGELVFSIRMPGYQETLTDPSYRGQAMLATAPHIGDTGWNGEDDESARTQVAGYVVRDPASRPSNWRSRRSLDAEFANQGIVGVCGINTRALTRHICFLGAMRVGISTRKLSPDRLRAKVLEQPVMVGIDLRGKVSVPEAQIAPAVGEWRFTVAAVDLDIKGMTPAQMVGRGTEVHVLPAPTSFEEIAALKPDRVFFSNGPSGPVTTDGPVTMPRQVSAADIPYFGICFGNQLFGRALGFGTYRLKFGRRDINQPVLDRTTGKVEITSQNHGLAVDAPLDRMVDTEFGQASVSHMGLNDDVVEGFESHRDGELVAFSIQYHPEAVARPYDANHLFDHFADLMRSRDAC